MSDEDLSVLVVDDDFRVASVHIGFVETVPGFRVVGSAGSAAQALAQARERHPDLVLMDVYLPDRNGLDVVGTLLAAQQPPGFIVISAANDLATVRRAVALGVSHYLVKPFGAAELAARLRSFAQMRRQLDRFHDDMTQHDVDALFGYAHPATTPANTHIRRLAPTLQSVLHEAMTAGGSVSASEVADATGMSRTTAQRALTALEQSGLLRLELRYGSTGRPEHRYSPTVT